jgi:hypothetical protein
MPQRSVASPAAVDALFAKLQVLAGEDPAWHRLVNASHRARGQFEHVQSPDARGFHHGLLTGYAVAVKALEGRLAVPPR